MHFLAAATAALASKARIQVKAKSLYAADGRAVGCMVRPWRAFSGGAA